MGSIGSNKPAHARSLRLVQRVRPTPQTQGVPNQPQSAMLQTQTTLSARVSVDTVRSNVKVRYVSASFVVGMTTLCDWPHSVQTQPGADRLSIYQTCLCGIQPSGATMLEYASQQHLVFLSILQFFLCPKIVCVHQFWPTGCGS